MICLWPKSSRSYGGEKPFHLGAQRVRLLRQLVAGLKQLGCGLTGLARGMAYATDVARPSWLETARKNIPAEANPYTNGTDEHSLWSAGHEQVAGEAEANESEGT